MDFANSEQTYAVIIAVERYQFNISNVNYAVNDAKAFYNWLKTDLLVPDENITMWLNHDATANALREEMRYSIRNLPEASRFIFYYAGHGFFATGSNRITTWDTHPTNLEDTTISLKDILLDPLLESQCNQSLIFIDACAASLKEQIISRDLLSDMNNREFIEFARGSHYQAIFASCSPGQKSYPSNAFQHGVWTYYLLQALRGEAVEAIYRDRYITDTSLQNYLRQVVPDFIRSKTEHRLPQIPWAQISATNTFVIRELGADKQNALSLPLMGIELAFEDMVFRNRECLNVRDLAGFRKGIHTEPNSHSASTRSWINRLMERPVTDEINTIYERCKDILRFRRKSMTKTINDGAGSLDTQLFRYIVDSSQHPDDPRLVLTIRTLQLLVDPSELPDGFERVFPVSLDEIVIPIRDNVDFDYMVEKFEEAEHKIGGQLYEDDNSGIIEYQTPDLTKLSISTEDSELILKPKGVKTIEDMLTGARKSVIALAQADQLQIE